MTTGGLSRANAVHAALLAAAAGLVCAYWAAFFLTDLTKPAFVLHPLGVDGRRLAAVYMGFEGAFPLADALVAVTLSLTAFYLLAGDRLAVPLGLVSAGAMLFLGLIDIWFNLAHGFYAAQVLARDPGLTLEAAINTACVVGPILSAWRLWSLRAALTCAEAPGL